MSKKFLNAYHFVPRKAPDKDAWLEDDNDKIERDLSKIDGDEKRVARFGLTENTITDGHAIYAPGRHSGRITCEVKLECPTVIGAKRYKPSNAEDETRYAVVEPFLYAEKPAIPASSLKGLISSIAESTSQSVYRALGNSVLTVAFAQSKSNGEGFITRYCVGVPQGDDDPERAAKKDKGGRSSNDKIGRTYEYFKDASLPLTLSATRSEVSPVDAMFGFVRDNDDEKSVDGCGKIVSVAGKLRFTHARLCNGWQDKDETEVFVDSTDYGGDPYEIDEFDNTGKKSKIGIVGKGFVRLKELGQPMKAPAKPKGLRRKLRNPYSAERKTESQNSFLRSATPSMYFKWSTDSGKAANAPISKREFGTTNSDQFRAQGGKFYLHHVLEGDGEPWSTNVSVEADREITINDQNEEVSPAAPRKSAVRPIRAGVTFRFHIDFDNLTDRELSVLCFSLRPSKRFRHKIGMGKGLGLGSVEISPEELKFVDRETRYTAEGVFDCPQSEASMGLDCFAECAENHSDWLQKNDRRALNALLKIGERHAFGDHAVDRDDLAETPVLWVPLTNEAMDHHMNGSAEAEKDSFKWFSMNERSNPPKQKLRPIADGKILPLQANGAPAKKTVSDNNKPINALSTSNQAPKKKRKNRRNLPDMPANLRDVKGELLDIRPTFRFIEPDDVTVNNVYVDSSAASKLRHLPEGTRVIFDTERGPKGSVARNIRLAK